MSAPRPAAFLVVNPSGNRQKVVIGRSPFLMGRQQDNDLTLRDNRISRLHARVAWMGDHYELEDNGSRHGVFVNGERVEGSRALRSSDRVEFGFEDSYQLTFLYDDDEISRLLQQIQTGPSMMPGCGDLGKLRAVVEVARTVQSSLSIDEVLAAVLDAALLVTTCERGFLMLRDGDRLAVRLARDRHGNKLPDVQPRLALDDLSQALNSRREFLNMRLSLPDFVCVPLVRVRAHGVEETHVASANQTTVGLLLLEGGQADASDGSNELLQTLALEASTVLENARLLEEERAKHRMEEELAIARTIQQELLPEELPSCGWFRAKGASIPSFHVGGDYYDVRAISPDTWSIVVADVSGKGVSSAILASLLQGAFLSSVPDPAHMPELLARVNRYIVERARGEKYATIFYAILDFHGRLCWTNAGHCTPIVVKADGRLITLEANGLPVGMLESASFAVERHDLEPGDKVVLYSDGLTDAQNEDGEFLRSKGLRAYLRAHAALGCHELHAGLLQHVREFMGGAGAQDDITLVIVEFRPAA
jgi:serine phosphatase RsbU (regulator of sigma subunit)